MSRRANTGHRQHQLAAQQQPPPPPRQRQRRHNNINNAAEREREREVARAESPDSSDMASCVSSVGNVQEEATSRYAGGDSPEETSSAAGADEGQMMMVMGCHRCMMYVMMTEDGQPRCPKCGSTVLLDLQEKTQGKRRVY